MRWDLGRGGEDVVGAEDVVALMVSHLVAERRRVEHAIGFVRRRAPEHASVEIRGASARSGDSVGGMAEVNGKGAAAERGRQTGRLMSGTRSTKSQVFRQYPAHF